MSGRSDPLDLSVIICVLNGENVIGEQLRALSRQSFTGAWEVVVVDNGSTDGTLAVVEGLRSKFSVPVRVVDASNRIGICAARNAGAKAAGGQVLAFCDCDDIVAEGWVKAAYEACRTADLVGGATRRLVKPFDPDAPFINAAGVLQSRLGPAVHGCNFAVRRLTYFGCGGFDEGLPPYGMDDTEFSYRLARTGGTVAGAPDMVVYFRETTDVRTLLRKVFMSGKAELVVWHRFPDVYRSRVRPLNLVREALAFFPEHARLAVRGQLPSGKQVLREGINRTARLAGYVTLVRGGRLTPPRLLAPEDDPLSGHRAP